MTHRNGILPNPSDWTEFLNQRSYLDNTYVPVCKTTWSRSTITYKASHTCSKLAFFKKRTHDTTMSSHNHTFHPHPLSKKHEVSSFPYSVSLSQPAPSHTVITPVTNAGWSQAFSLKLAETKCSHLNLVCRIFDPQIFPVSQVMQVKTLLT